MTLLENAEGSADKAIDIDGLIVQLLREVRAEQGRMADTMEKRTQQIEEISSKLDAHADESNKRHAQILGAFPADDIEGHRRYHEAVIKRIELRNDIIRECLKKAAQLGFLGGLAWLCKAIYHSMKNG